MDVKQHSTNQALSFIPHGVSLVDSAFNMHMYCLLSLLKNYFVYSHIIAVMNVFVRVHCNIIIFSLYCMELYMQLPHTIQSYMLLFIVLSCIASLVASICFLKYQLKQNVSYYEKPSNLRQARQCS